MSSPLWMALFSGAMSFMLAVVGGMFALGYRDISRRLVKLEKQDSKLFSAVMTILISQGGNDPKALAEAMHGLLTNGVERII